MHHNRKIWLTFILLVIVIGTIYGFTFQRKYPEIVIGQSSLYGINNKNIKDFVIDDSGVLISQSADPWVTYSLHEPISIAYIAIKASNVQDLNGNLHIFDTNSWKDKIGKLRNGRNGYYFFDKSDQWVTQDLRFDLVEMLGATCRIDKIVINPVQNVWFIGFVRMFIPLSALLIAAFIIQYGMKCIAKIHHKSTTKEIIHIVVSLVLSMLASYFVLLNLRVTVNTTNLFTINVLLYLLFYMDLPAAKDKRSQCLVLLFSILLSMANNLGSHVIVAQAPYSDLMDKSYIVPYTWKDAIGIAVMVIVIYRCIFVIVQMISRARVKLIKKKFLFTRSISFAIPMLIMFLCWLPYFILYYPGFIFGDSVGQIKQAIGVATFSNHHPVFHTLLIQICIRIGELYGNLTFGCALYVFFQMLYISFSLGKLVEWLSQHQVPFLFICIITGAYAIIPYFGQTSIAMWKDPAFGASVVLLTISVLDYNSITIVSDEEKTNKQVQIKCFAKIVLFALLTCFLRNNGVYALIFACLCLLILLVIKKNRQELAKLMANLVTVICFYFVITGPIYSVLKITPTEKVESVGVCINQMASVAASDDGIMSEEERKFMNELLPIEKYKETYRPCAVDLLKWDSDFNSDCLNNSEFIKTYLSMGVRNPGKYVGAWALMTFGYWAPNRWELNSDSDNLIKGNFHDVLISGLPIRVVDPNAHSNNLLYKIFKVQGSILSLGTLDWILLFAMLVMLLQREWKGLIAISLSVGIMITLVIASPYWYWQRYGMAQYYLFPIYLYFIVTGLKSTVNILNLKEQEAD